MTKLDVDAYVGKRLKQRRTMLGYTQDVVAKSVGVTFQQVQKYEKGTNAMNASRLLEFARFMNVPVSYFFEELEAEAAADKKSFTGMAEATEAFDHETGRVSDRESLEMMKAFKRIGEQPVRKRLSDLVRAIADNKTMLD
jgi:transcriptional regulator with XRE-family HTH domain